jgi:hypothetical protein
LDGEARCCSVFWTPFIEGIYAGETTEKSGKMLEELRRTLKSSR